MLIKRFIKIKGFIKIKEIVNVTVFLVVLMTGDVVKLLVSKMNRTTTDTWREYKLFWFVRKLKLIYALKVY